MYTINYNVIAAESQFQVKIPTSISEPIRKEESSISKTTTGSRINSETGDIIEDAQSLTTKTVFSSTINDETSIISTDHAYAQV